jgi:hypothetical protein
MRWLVSCKRERGRHPRKSSAQHDDVHQWGALGHALDTMRSRQTVARIAVTGAEANAHA